MGVSRITGDLKPGSVIATSGYWRQLKDGTVNSISSAELVNMGNAPRFRIILSNWKQ